MRDYKADYPAAYFEGAAAGHQIAYHSYDGAEGLLRDLVTWVLPLFNYPSTVCDVGAASGHVVQAFIDQGSHCWGYEYSPAAVSMAHSKGRTTVQEGDIRDLPDNPRAQLVTCFECLEHIPQEDTQLAITNLLKTGGIVATIICLTESEHLQSNPEGDPTHINLHPRQWWIEQIVEAGGVMEDEYTAFCNAHPQSTTMSWTDRWFVFRKAK